MACNPLDPFSCVGDLTIGGMAALAKAWADSATWSVKTMMTAWMRVDSPSLEAGGSAVVWLQAHTSYFVLVVAFLSVMWAAYRMATSGEFSHLIDLAKSMAKLIVVSGTAAAAATIGLQVGDAYSKWILGSSTDFSALIAFTTLTKPAVSMLLSAVVILAQLIQLMIMLAKNAMVVALVGFLPLTSAATNTTIGKQGFLKAITWLGAFLLYKPLAATIYALAFKMSGQRQTMVDQLAGIMFMLLAILALPALMKFLVPAAASVSGGNAGAISAAVVGAALATGATLALGAAKGGGFGGFSGGGGGGSGPSGATSNPLPDLLQSAASGAQLTRSANPDEVVDKP
jgi:type IV secretion system protein TrbL